MSKGDLIRREDAVKLLHYHCDEHCSAVISDFEELPTVDAVEVVQCKDCKWWNKPGCAILIVDDSDRPDGMDFCSFSERRKDDAAE